VFVFATVLLIGFIASLIASRNISKIEDAGLAATIKQE
jgi:ABC-type antimicrobial peptide transport system permease subunit